MFVEGSTDAIFVRVLADNYLPRRGLEIRSVEQLGPITQTFWSEIGITSNGPDRLLQIVEVDNDSTVVSKIRENYAKLLNVGYTRIIGLRDLKSQKFDRVGETLIEDLRRTVKQFDEQNVVALHFAKMEIEAWFLASPSFLHGIHPGLTVKRIAADLNCDLDEIDPQEDLPNPTRLIKAIYKLEGKRYRKKKNDVNAIVYNLDWETLVFQCRQAKKISYFFDFLDEIDRIF